MYLTRSHQDCFLALPLWWGSSLPCWLLKAASLRADVLCGRRRNFEGYVADSQTFASHREAAEGHLRQRGS